MTLTQIVEKALAWLEAGRCVVLVADPERRTVTVYRSREDIRILIDEAGEAIDGADVVPGWKLPVAEIFVGRGWYRRAHSGRSGEAVGDKLSALGQLV